MLQQNNIKDILKRYWGYSTFRGIQENIINSILEGKDTLGLMPTGGGKSITFQVPALCLKGTCIVITPLIALMKDQVYHLRKKNINASAIYSGMSRNEILAVLDNCILGNTKLLYISPERIASEIFIKKISKMKISFITIDEAHCISQWGYDFRPSYLRISDIRNIKKEYIPLLALTATATPNVIEDIQDKLEFREKNVFKMSFERKNLAYIVRESNNKEQELIHILNMVKGSSIVYVRSRLKAKDISKLLSENNITNTFYHAGLEHITKDKRQTEWQNDEARVMVATNAFGMGIDKPDVRLVIHIDCPDSIETYFQEAGRAGRDGNKAYAILLYNDSDEKKLNKRIVDTFPDKDYIKLVYEHLAYFFQIGYGSGEGQTFPFNEEKFCITFRHFATRVNSALLILSRAGYIKYEHDPESSSRIIFLLERNELYLLKELSPKDDIVITTLLRLYGGLFVDYAYIDENIIAEKTNLTRQQVYLILKGLNQRHIIHYIPQKKSPLITYTQMRLDPKDIILSDDIYKYRKEEYEHRIKSVITYAKYNDICRSRQLLRYFGEERSCDCGQCDVCLSHKEDKNEDTEVKDAIKKIETLLIDGNKHIITELYSLNIPSKYCKLALKKLSNEEQIIVTEGFIKKA